MTLQQIDESLAEWDSRLAAVADNLLWLQGDSTYRALTGAGGAARVQLEGMTAAAVGPVVGAARTIFEHFGLLHATIDQAAKLRAEMPSLFGVEQKLKDIQNLLSGKSIQLPAVHVPLDQRSLLSGMHGVNRISPGELLELMAKTFAAARDAVLAVDRAWQELATSIAEGETQLRRLEAQQAAAGAGLQELSARLMAVRAKVPRDPFSAHEEWDQQIRPLLAQLQQKLAHAERLRQELAGARDLLQEVLLSRRQAQEAAAEARVRIADCSGLPSPVPEEKIDRLREWLEQIERRHAGGEWETVETALRNWKTAARESAVQERKVAADSRAAIEARRELRGRFDALKAKARGRGIAEAEDVVALAEDADGLLATKPTDMARTAEAIQAYARRLNGTKRE